MANAGRNSTSFKKGQRAAAGNSTRKLTRGDLAPYRARFIAGETLAELAPDVVAEFRLGSEEKALSALRRRSTGDGWTWQREAFRERAGEIILAQNQKDIVQGYLDRVAVDGDFLLDAGMEALARLQPATVTEALDMIKTGTALGLRGRNLPERIRMPNIIPLLSPTEPAAVDAAQRLSPGTYEALAAACDAEFAVLPAGPAAAGGRD